MKSTRLQAAIDVFRTVPVDQLKLGMFVAELDRPWSDTPFLLEGLLLETEADLAAVVNLCACVTIDLSRSVDVEDDVLPAKQAAAPSDRHLEAASAWLDVGEERPQAVTARAPDGPHPMLASPAPEMSPMATGTSVPSAPAPRPGGPGTLLLAVIRELLEAYLRPSVRPPPLLHAPAALQDAPPSPNATPPHRRPGALARAIALLWAILRDLRRPGRARVKVREMTLVATTTAPPRASPVGGDRPPGFWKSVTRALREIFRSPSSRRRRQHVTEDRSWDGQPAEPAFREPTEATPGTQRGPRLAALAWLALRKLLGLYRPKDDAASASAASASPGAAFADASATRPTEPPDDEPHETELEQARAAAESFQQSVRSVAPTLSHGMSLMQATLKRAELGVPPRIDALQPMVSEIVDSVLRNADATLWLSRLQAHDQTAHARAIQTSVYMTNLGSQLGLKRGELEVLALAGVLLDIGKMRVPAAILQKPGPLDADELQQARLHVTHTMDLLRVSGALDQRVIEAITRHHEREDGSGYPGRLYGEAIGLYGRIAGIVDTFLALSSRRPHAAAASMDDCLRLLMIARGTLFHAPLVEHFIQMLGPYPVGSLVRLSTGEVAAVLSHNRVRRLLPRVLVMTDPQGVRLDRPMPLDLLYRPRDTSGEEISIARGLPAGSHGISAADLYAATVPE